MGYGPLYHFPGSETDRSNCMVLVVGYMSTMGTYSNSSSHIINLLHWNASIMSKTILITGAAGMIGSNLVHHLLETTDHRIIGIDNLSGGYWENLPPHTSEYYPNLKDDSWRLMFQVRGVGEDLSILFAKYQPDIVYHCAAYAAEGLSPFIRKFNYTNNVVGTANIVNNCIEYGVKRLVFFSSIAVYGHGPLFGPGPFKEFHVPQPIDPYGVAKYACELDIKVAAEQHDLDYVIVRPFNVYGERQNIWDPYRNVLGIWMYNYLNNKPIQIYGDGEQQRSFTYVQDIMEPLRELGENPAHFRETFNIGSSVPYTLNELAKIFQATVGKCDIEYLPARHEVKKAICSVDKYQDRLESRRTTLQAGMHAMWEWVKAQPPRERAEGPRHEITKGVYEHWKK